MSFLNDRDYRTLDKVHPSLVATVLLAAESWAREESGKSVFRVTCGYRTPAEQIRVYEAGQSKTRAGFHPLGLAVDLALLTPDREAAIWDFDRYRPLDMHMRAAAAQVGCKLLWGGNWLTLRDGVHWQLRDRETLLP